MLWGGYIDFEQAINKSKARMAQNAQLQLIDQNAKWVKEIRDDTVYSLNLEKYKKEIEENKKQSERFDAIDEYKSSLEYTSLPYEVALIENDSVLAKKRDRWHKNLNQDVYMEEAVNVLEDMKTNTIRKANPVTVKN